MHTPCTETTTLTNIFSSSYETVHVLSETQSAQVIRYPDGRSKGWGLVEFVDASGAAEAIANFNDVDLMGRKIFIREDRAG